MARTLTQVELEIDNLRANLAKGILRSRHGDVEITYQNVTEMRSYLRELEAELAGLSGTRVKQVRFLTRKGL